jgi:type I restriction-modification system DNA methylase subunit
MKEILRLESDHLQFLHKNRNKLLNALKMIDEQIDTFEDTVEYIINYLDKHNKED